LPGSDASRRRFVVALVLLAAVFAFGAWIKQDPDFDVTFGIEAWRRWGPLAAALAAVAIGVLVASRRAAEAVASAAEAVVRRIPPRARVPLLLAAALALFVVFEDVSLSGDGTAAVHCAIIRLVVPSNALTSWLDFAAVDVLGAVGLDPVVSIRAVSWAAGLVGIACGVALARTLFDDAPRRTAAAFLLLTTGNVALFFGSLEIYVPLGAAVLAYLLVSVRAMRGVGSPHLPPLVLGVAFVLHGAAGLLLLSLALLTWDPLDGRGRNLRETARRVGVAGALFLVPVAATVAGLYFGTWHGSLPPAGHDRWGNFLGGAQSHGPLLALRFGPADVGSRYALLDVEHALAVLTTIFVAAPAAWALLALRAPRPTQESVLDRRLVWFAVSALVPWVVYPCVWTVSYALRRDWDMFSPLGALAAFVAAILALRHRGDRAMAVRIAALCLFSFVPFVVSHAGDFKDRRQFAMAAASAFDQSRVRGDEEVHATSVRRWDDETRRLDETGAAAWIDEGDALGAKGRFAEAATKYQEAVEAEPDNASAQFCLGSTLLRLGRRDEARGHIVAALSMTNEDLRVNARHALGRMAYEDGNLQEAVRQYERALHECSFVPEAGPIARDLAKTWRRLGREDLAASVDLWAAAQTPK
jgi:tetratricopeptide (TPR) repeat protein